MNPKFLKRLTSATLQSACLLFCTHTMANTATIQGKLVLPEVARPIDDFAVQDLLTGYNLVLNPGPSLGVVAYADAARPIDDFVDFNVSVGNSLANGVSTLKDQLQLAGNFPLARALLVDGQTALLGANPNLNTFENSTLETPIGGQFSENASEEELRFRKPLFNRKSRFDNSNITSSLDTTEFPRTRSSQQRSNFFNRGSRFDRVSVFDKPSRYQVRRAQQRALIKTYR